MVRDRLGPSSELTLFQAMCRSASPVESSLFEEYIGVTSAVSAAAKRLSEFVERFSQEFPMLREEHVTITIPRKRGHVQVGYHFACWNALLKEYVPPEDAKRLLEKAWIEWAQIGTGTRAGAFEQHLRKSADFIKDRTRDFVGRKFVFKAVRTFVRSHDCGYFFIKGDPGIGKSSVAASLVRKNGYIHHFNNRARGTGTTDVFLRNVCSQLILTYGLDYASLPAEAARNGNFLAGLLEKASQASKPSTRVVIVVDALDEVGHAPPDGANLLYLPPILPKNVFVIATSRRQELPLRIECPHDTIEIKPRSSDNREDIRAYLKRKARGCKIGAYVRAQKLDRDSFVEIMGEKSQGNFMYLHYVLPEIEKGAYKDLAFERLPVGLQNYYEDHWRRMGMMAGPPPDTKLKVLYILSEVRNPLSRRVLAKYSGVDEVPVQRVLDEWREFLHPIPGGTIMRYSLYHDTFRDFLNRKDIIQASGVNLRDIVKHICVEILSWIDDD
jgi:hypothetical protein